MIRLTPAAASALKTLLEEEGAPDHGLRIQVVGGGCEGLYYDFALEARAAEGDEVVEASGVRLFVDRRALPLLDGATLDYPGELRFDNPNARRTCRCGASFR